MSTEIEKYIERAERAQRYNKRWCSECESYNSGDDPFYGVVLLTVIGAVCPVSITWGMYLFDSHHAHIATHTPFILTGLWLIIFIPLLMGFRSWSRDFQWMCALRNRPDLREEYLDDCAPEKPIERLEAYRKATRRSAVEAMNK